jgi:uncharacterized protein (AIM24 family)
VQAFRLNGSRVLEIDLAGDAMRAATGAMIAYTGDVSFRSPDGRRRRAAFGAETAGPASRSPLELKQSIVPGFLTLIGTGKFLASSSGPVIFAEPPIRVDPQALVGWADCPSPSHHFDARWMSGFLASAMGMLGVNSGEERQFDFTGAGTVLIQSSERGVSDPHLLRQLEGQVGTLNQPGLPRIQQVVQERLQQQRR